MRMVYDTVCYPIRILEPRHFETSDVKKRLTYTTRITYLLTNIYTQKQRPMKKSPIEQGGK